jgi:hypothetical protein
MKIKLSIQSISSIITNSSSELFAIIDANKEVLDSIYEILNNIFGDYQESEITPVVTLCRRPTKVEIEDRFGSNYNSWRYFKEKDVYSLPEYWIEVELPYCLDDCTKFFSAGLEAILKEKFGDSFKIEYEGF